MRLPSVGSRVSLRYRLPAGSEPPLTEAVGHLEAVAPQLRLRTRSGELVTVEPADLLNIKEISVRPVRTSQIRALEHAAALARPCPQQDWVDGWLVRAGSSEPLLNTAVPLEVSAQISGLAGVARWYDERELPALLALPERLLPLRSSAAAPEKVLVRDLTDMPDIPGGEPVELTDGPGAATDGAVTVARLPGAAVAQAAVTTAPDGSSWLGIFGLRVDPAHRRAGLAGRVCATLLDWAAGHGATRAYLRVPADDEAALGFAESLDFRLHHRCRYVEAQALLGGPPPTI